MTKRSGMLRLQTVLAGALLFGAFAPGAVGATGIEGEKEGKGSPFHNLALGKPYSVSGDFYDVQLAAYENRTSRDNGSEYELTDGKIAGNKQYDGYCGCEVFFLDKNWIGYNRQVHREITVDLGSKMFIQTVQGGFLQERTAAVELPRTLKVYLSDDGKSWYQGGEHRTNLIAASQEANRQVLGVDNVNASARFVKLEFEVSMFTFIDELEVLGREKGGGRPVHTLPPAEAPADVPAPTLEEAGGVHNMYITYLYPEDTGNGHLGKWTKDDFKHILAHVDESGNRTGWLFDSVLPLSASGGSDYRTDYQQQQSWEAILSKLFVRQSETVPPAGVTNSYLTELNAAAEEAQVELGDPSRKIKVVVGVPFPDPGSAKWGIIDGQEINFNPDVVGEEAAYESRLKAVDWFVGQVTDRFAQGGYENLELAGFYWIHEEISYETMHEEKLMKAIADRVHARSKKLYWIPFYMANGTNFWKELGFDVVMMQPNYYFASSLAPNQTTGQTDLQRLTNAVKAAKRFGMTLEVEGDYHMSWKGWAPDYDGQIYNSDYARRKYYAYLNEFHKAGLDRSTLVYYLGAKTVLKEMVYDSRDEVREVYDITRGFVNGIHRLIDIPQTDLPMPAGDSWSTPIMMEAADGSEYTHYFPITDSKWVKFPIKAGEDWKVTLTPLEGANVSMESRHWGEAQTAHSGFSYGKAAQPQSLLVQNPGTADSAIMLRIFPDGAAPGGKFKLTLSKPVEDGASMMNAMKLPNGATMEGTASAGQELWYKIAGQKAYDLVLAPGAGADFRIELYWDANSGGIQAVSDAPIGELERIRYSNIFAPNFLFYVKVKTHTDGTFKLSNGSASAAP